MIAFLADRWLPLIVNIGARSTTLLLLAGLTVLFLRRASAAARHLVWLPSVIGLLVLPLLSLMLPAWRVPVAASSSKFFLPTFTAPNEIEGLNSDRKERLPALKMPVPSPPTVMTEEQPSPRPALPGRMAGTPPEWLRVGVLTFVLWLIGALIVIVRLFVGLVVVARLRLESRPAADGPTAVMLSSLMPEGRCPDLRLGPTVPLTYGWFRSVLLLPAEAEVWPAERLRVVLLHEIAHIRRSDWLAQTLAEFVCALYWFNPLVWVAARQLRAEAERACDDCVLAAGIVPADYGRHLLDIARSRQAATIWKGAAVTMAQQKTIEFRLREILSLDRSRQPPSRHARLLAAFLMFSLLVPLAVLRPSAQAKETSFAPPSEKGIIVVVDAGHGGEDTGGKANDGTLEKDLNLAIAQKLRASLVRRGMTVYMTRETDAYSTLSDRVAFVKARHPDFLISVHCDGQPNTKTNSGIVTYYHAQDAPSLRLAAAIERQAARASDLPESSVLSDTTLFPAGFALLRNSPVPAVVVECGFLNNAKDLMKLRDPQVQQHIATGVAAGLSSYIAVFQPRRPEPVTHPEAAEAQLRRIYQFIQVYRRRHHGQYPGQPGYETIQLINDMAQNRSDYGLPARNTRVQDDAVTRYFENPDVRYTDLYFLILGASWKSMIAYNVSNRRPDGSPVGSPSSSGRRDVLATTDLYVHHQFLRDVTGFYLVLWDDGQVERITPDRVVWIPNGAAAFQAVPEARMQSSLAQGRLTFRVAFPEQKGLPPNTYSSARYWRLAATSGS